MRGLLRGGCRLDGQGFGWFCGFRDAEFGFACLLEADVLCALCFFVFAGEPFEEAGGWAFFLFGAAYALVGGDGAEVGVVDEFFDGGFGVACCNGFGQVEAGDLEAVEQQAGAARVDFIGDDALEDVADSELDGAAVFRVGEDEVGGASLARGEFFWRDGAAGGVVEVAK